MVKAPSVVEREESDFFAAEAERAKATQSLDKGPKDAAAAAQADDWLMGWG